MRLRVWLPRFHRSRKGCPECGATVEKTYCKVCGYDLVRKTRNEAAQHRPPI